MLKVLVACGNGIGTNVLIKNKAEKTFRKLGLEADFDHSTINEAMSGIGKYDLVLTPKELVKQFELPEGSSVTIIGLSNVLSEAELIEKLRLYEFIK